MTDTLAAQFRDVVSGSRRGITAMLARGALRIAEVPYTLAVRWRNRQFNSGRRPSETVGVPVISIGNLTLGGTGKTPMVEWVCRWFRDRGIRITIVSRGYKAEDGAANDEALELESKLPDVPHVQNPNRVEAARMAVEEFACQAIVLDDAFQHRQIARDLDIVLLDALEPFGFEHVFPRGTLREPLVGLCRADIVVLTRADMISEQQRVAIKTRVARIAPNAAWAECVHAPVSLLNASGEERGLGDEERGLGDEGRGMRDEQRAVSSGRHTGSDHDTSQLDPQVSSLKSQASLPAPRSSIPVPRSPIPDPAPRSVPLAPPVPHVAAFCGIGNPAGFRHTIAVCGYDLTALREFPDHHNYTRENVQDLAGWAANIDVSAILCTHKDLVKLGVTQLGGKPLWAVRIGLSITVGREQLEDRLAAIAARIPEDTL